AAVPTLDIDGTAAQVFTNGRFSYVVTNVRIDGGCPGNPGRCFQRAQQIQVVELANGAAVPRGKLQLPADPWGWYGWGWEGVWWDDWWGGGEVLQVGGDMLAFRRWGAKYDANG